MNLRRILLTIIVSIPLFLIGADAPMLDAGLLPEYDVLVEEGQGRLYNVAASYLRESGALGGRRGVMLGI